MAPPDCSSTKPAGVGGSLLSFLEGTWTLTRALEDRGRGVEGRFEGIATFVLVEEGICTYEESGELLWPGYRGPATRALRCLATRGDAVTFLFLDGRLFHELSLGERPFVAVHECGEDRYEGSFVLLGEDEWQATWDVQGPKKSQRLRGRYRRRLQV